MRNLTPALAAVAAAALLSVQPATARVMPASCAIAWTGISRVVVGDQKLSALVMTGSYRGEAGDGAFTIMDDDGFLTLAILTTQWWSDGRAGRNLTGPVSLTKGELELAARAARIGTAYQASLLRAGGTDLEDEPAEYEARQEFFRALAADVRDLAAKAGPNGVSVPAGFIRDRFGKTLERLAPDSPNRIQVYYIDPAKPDEGNAFCDPKAANALVGKILCSRNFVTGMMRTGAPCLTGIGFNDLAALPVSEPEPAP